MTAIARAYASNEATPLSTLEFSHPSISTMYFVQAYEDLTASLETGSVVTFRKSSFDVRIPQRSTDGTQELQIQIDNITNEAYQALNTIQQSMRSSPEKAIIKRRSYLESDLSSPSDGVLRLILTSAVVNRNQASISAKWAPFPESVYPRYRYYGTVYPGVKYQ